MIELTFFNNSVFYLNCELLEKIEANPDTVITLTNNKKFVVKESPEEIIERIIAYKKSIYGALPQVIKHNYSENGEDL